MLARISTDPGEVGKSVFSTVVTLLRSPYCNFVIVSNCYCVGNGHVKDSVTFKKRENERIFK